MYIEQEQEDKRIEAGRGNYERERVDLCKNIMRSWRMKRSWSNKTQEELENKAERGAKRFRGAE